MIICLAQAIVVSIGKPENGTEYKTIVDPVPG